MTNFIRNGLVALSIGVAGLTADKAEAQQPLEYRGPGIQVGGVDMYRVWSLQPRIVNTPVYQRFDTYAQTPCGPQYVGSSCVEVGKVPTVVHQWKERPVIEWNSDKSIFGAIGRFFECPQRVHAVPVRPTPQICAPVVPIPQQGYQFQQPTPAQKSLEPIPQPQ